MNGAAALSSTGMPAVADLTAASTQDDDRIGASDARELSLHSGRGDRQRAGSARPAG
jgi:hypothetical protein